MLRAPLLERAEELSHARHRLASVCAGAGGMLLVEGAAGIGKSRLLTAVRELGEGAGMEVLSARGSALEREFVFGIARQLLEPVVASGGEEALRSLPSGAATDAPRIFGGDARSSARPPSVPSFGVLHALYQLIASRARQRPLLVIVDDAHWGDIASLRFLPFLASRIDQLPVMVAVARRHGECDTRDALLAQISDACVTTIRPRPLSEAAVAELVRAQLGADADPLFALACHRAVAGNPFMLSELLRELLRERIVPSAREAGTVASLCPRAISRAVLLRLGRLSHRALDLARAVAVLGDGAELQEAATLAGLQTEAAAEAVDALARVAILRRERRLSFVHPIVREAIANDIGPRELGGRHRAAARILAADGASAERVAAHLLEAEAVADPHVVARLREAAAGALACGSPEAAIAYLRRALEEPPADCWRDRVALRLATVESRTGDPAGLPRLLDVAQAASDPRLRARALVEAGRVKATACGRLGTLIDALERARTALPDDAEAAALELDAERLSVAVLEPSTAGPALERVAVVRDRLVGGRPAAGRLLAVAAYASAQAAEPADTAVELARTALARGRLLGRRGVDWLSFIEAAHALLMADRFDEVADWSARALERAQQQRSVSGFAAVSALRSHLAYRRGNLPSAEAEARTALEMAVSHGLGLIELTAAAFLADALCEAGGYDEADAVLARVTGGGESSAGVFLNCLLCARGRLRRAQGKHREGLDDMLACGRREQALGAANPARFAWRSDAALALAQLGETADATALARKELALARRFGAPRAVGIALRAAGALAPDELGLALLGEATQTLARSGARLEHARALAALGNACLRVGELEKARAALSAALDLAHRCGAAALAQEARRGLVQAGRRPRRPFARGPDALTTCERRVAQMAADGASNRDIAEALHVAQKTVEKHLGSAYSKLGVSCRAELPKDLLATNAEAAVPEGIPC